MSVEQVYTANQRSKSGVVRSSIEMCRNVYVSRDLIWQLFRRDFLATYRKSFFGLAWLVLSPLVTIISWVLMQGAGLLQPGQMTIPYPVYALVGASIWGFFVSAYSAAAQALTASHSLIIQVSFPHEALLFKELAQALAGFLITVALNGIVLAVFGISPHWKAILFPLVLLPTILLAAGAGLIVSMLSVVAMDINRLIQMGLSVAMFLSPIVYVADSAAGILGIINDWNPLTFLICSARDIVLYGKLFNPTGYFITSFASLILFLLSWRFFYIAEGKIVEKLV